MLDRRVRNAVAPNILFAVPAQSSHQEFLLQVRQVVLPG
jgi:hypothetical protein